MKNFLSLSKNRELLAITYNTDSIFEYESASLKPGALNEMKRTAHMISLYPNRVIHIEIVADTHRLVAKSYLYGNRVQAIKDIFIQQRIDAGVIQTTTQRGASAQDVKDTISVKVMDSLVEPLTWIGQSWQQENPSYCQTCRKGEHHSDTFEGLRA